MPWELKVIVVVVYLLTLIYVHENDKFYESEDSTNEGSE